MPVEGQDPAFTAVNRRADEMLATLLEDAGIPPDQFEEAIRGSEISLVDLAKMLGTAWAVHARIAARTEEWTREAERRKRAHEVLYAREYFGASKALPKGTEAAKRNWIVTNSPDIGESEAHVAEAEYLAALHKAARKAMELRCDMLQSLNKLRVAEMGLGYSMEPPPDSEIAGRG